ncbi:MAG: protein kinase [Nannocystaceae bacterium]
MADEADPAVVAARAERARTDATPPDLSGTVLHDRYELVRRIGLGGMGEVYEARFLASGQRVAVKLLFQRLAESEEMLTRFRHELRALEAIRHPAIVTARDFDCTAGGRPYLVMEFVEGEDLSRRRRRPVAEVARVGLQVCSALEALHADGIFHRDLTRRNILACGEGRDVQVKVIDFGVSKLSALHYSKARPYQTPPGKRLQTRTGLVFGTPGYMAPEATEEPACPRQDVYSLGVVLYELIVGAKPPLAWLTEISADVDYEALGLDALTWRVLLKAIEPDPSVRYQSATDFKEALEDLLLNVDDEGAAEPDDAARSRERAVPSQVITEERVRAETREAADAESMSEAQQQAAGADRSAGPAEARPEGASPKPSRSPSGLVQTIALAILGSYVAVDLALHLQGGDRAPPLGTVIADESATTTQEAAARSTPTDNLAAGPTPTSGPPPTATAVEPIAAPREDAASVASRGAPSSATLPSAAETSSTSRTVAPRPRSLSAPAFRRAVAPQRDALALCTRGLSEADAPSATVEIARDGAVSRVTVTPEVSFVVERCVARTIESIHFPSADRASTHTLRLPHP